MNRLSPVTINFIIGIYLLHAVNYNALGLLKQP